MRLLHTSDLHLGRQLNGVSLEEDHQEILSQILEKVSERKPDALVIAGDIYDRASPPASAVKCFNGFLRQLLTIAPKMAVVVIAGNHDSGDRIDSIATLADPKKALIQGPLVRDQEPIVLNDKYGPVAISALPYAGEYVGREVFQDPTIGSPEDVIRAQMAAARGAVPEGARWIVTSHAFVANAKPSESERKLSVGGIETVAPDAYDGAHYVALGHLHRPQTAGGDHIVYSGSPLAFSFDEGEAPKSMSLVEMDGKGNVEVERIAFKPLRKVRVLRGLFDDLIRRAEALPSDDFIKLELEDEASLLDPMQRIRRFYQNALEIQFVRQREATDGAGNAASELDNRNDPIKVVSVFLNEIRQEEPTEEDLKIIGGKLDEIREQEGQE